MVYDYLRAQATELRTQMCESRRDHNEAMVVICHVVIC